MNTEHTKQSRQAANAAFEQWWQRHGLEDPMDDEDRYYITASSWARRGYLAAMQAQQAEPVAYLKTAASVMQLSFEGRPFVNAGADVEVQADTVQPPYAQPPAVAVPVELRSVFDQMFDYSVDPTDDVSREWLWRFSKGLVGRLSSKPPAVAVPDGYMLAPIEPTTEMVLAGAEDDSQFFEHAKWVYRAMLAAAPQAATEAPDLVAQLRALAKQHGWNSVWSKARLIEAGTKTCHKCHGSGLTHSCLCVHYDKAKEQEEMAEYRAATQKGGAV